jgi:hypothetical protein
VKRKVFSKSPVSCSWALTDNRRVCKPVFRKKARRTLALQSPRIRGESNSMSSLHDALVNVKLVSVRSAPSFAVSSEVTDKSMNCTAVIEECRC